MNANQTHLKIAFKVASDKSLSPVEFTFKHTDHSFQRACQRGINQVKIIAALQFGETVYKQGLIYYILGENNIPESLSRNRKQLKNTVVIVAGDSNQVITCYRSPNPFKNIRLKSERLGKKFSNAA